MFSLGSKYSNSTVFTSCPWPIMNKNLTRSVDEMNGASELLAPLVHLQSPQRLHVLNTHAFHVLSPAGENIAFFVFEGAVRIVGPVVLEDKDPMLRILCLIGLP
jgi:hypothetical protein